MTIFLAGCNNLVTSGFNCKNLTENYWETIEDYKPEKAREFILLLDKVIKESPRCKNAYALRGEILFSLQRYKEAKRDFLSLLKIDSNNVYAYFETGLIYELQTSFDSAIFFYEKAIQKKTQGTFIVDNNNEIERLYGKRGFDVKYLSIKLRKGIANYFRGNLKAAINDLNYCIKKEYLLNQAYFYRGLIYISANQKEKACRDFKEAQANGNTEAHETFNKYCE
jgi:tetratricopeptide (TPR) repeat protein